MGKAFISYSHKNMEFVEKVNRLLNEAHVLTWFDKNSIRAGDQWETNIATSIYSCDVFVMFYSKPYRDSYYCQKEYEIYKHKKNPTPLIVVGLDDARDSFFATEATAYQFIDYDYENGTAEELASLLLSCQPIRHCTMLYEEGAAGPSTDFLNALQNLQRPKHYDVIEPLIRFLLWLEQKEGAGQYIASGANFSSLAATPLGAQRFSLALTGKEDLSPTFCKEVRNNYIRNVFYALFKFGRVEFSTPAPRTLQFESLFLHSTHHFLQAGDTSFFTQDAYGAFNKELAALYEQLPEPHELIRRLTTLYNASKFFETQELFHTSEKQLDYEVNPLILSLSKRLFAFENGLNQKSFAPVFPSLIIDGKVDLRDADAGTNWSTYADPKTVADLLTQSKSLVLRGDYGSGKTAVLLEWFKQDPCALYIDLTTQNALHGDHPIRSIIEGQTPSLYKLHFHSLFNYSVCHQKVTLLVDNIDNLSEENRKKALSEIVRLSGAFRVVLVSSKHNLEEKISLNRDGDSFSNFRRYALQPLTPEQIVQYLDFSLTEKGVDSTEIVGHLTALPKEETFFEIFNNFTKLDILIASVPDWSEFTVEEISARFNSRIRVYQNIFESDCEYSIPKKIASLFKESVVNIEDVIVALVLREIDLLKQASYEGCGLPTCPIEESSIRFRDYYPILTKIMGRYAFLNEDIRSYFAASFVHSQIEKTPGDYDGMETLLAPVKNNYLVLKYLGEFGVLSKIDLEYLLVEESYRENLISVLYKILQYEKDATVRAEFLQNASFSTLPDKFFMGAENITKIVVPPCVESVGRATFANMPLLREIDFAPRGIVRRGGKKPLTVKPWAILNCPALTTIRFGANYEAYHHPLFSRCFALSRIEVDPKNQAFTTLLGGQMLVSKDEKVLYCSTNSLSGEVRVPDTLEKLKGNSLSYLQKVTSVVIPKSTIEIDTNFTDFCDNLLSITVEEGNPVYYSDENGLMFTQTEQGKTLFRAPSGLKNDLVIPSDVAVIGSDSISCCSWVKHIFVPRSVRFVENYAFADTYSLQTLTFEDIDEVEKFGDYIFLSTKQTAKIISGEEAYSLKAFHTTFCRMRESHKLRGVVRKPITAQAFTSRGFELLQKGEIPQTVQNAVLARDVTLFNDAVYRPQDFNMLMIGLTEYNAVLTKTPVQAEAYLKDLITKNNVSMIVLSRDLPNITIFETAEEYARLLIVRTGKSSSSATAMLAEIIRELGENK